MELQDSDPRYPAHRSHAQDFKAAFGVGETNTSITTIDADGIALAAIQGLNQKVDEQAKQLRTKEVELQSLKQTVARLEQRISGLVNKIGSE